jgi:transposase
MYTKDLKEKVWQARHRGFSWNKLEQNFGVPKSSCRDFVRNYGQTPTVAPKNHLKIKGNKKKRLVLAIQRLTDDGERITASNVIYKSNVSVSMKTVQRFLKKEGLKYMNPQNTVVLSSEHNALRMEICKKWLIQGSANNNIVFTDESDLV